MKRKILIGTVLLVTLITSAFIYHYKLRSRAEGAAQAPIISYYTCPMHHQIHADKPGECPICHMTLVPVYKETSPAPTESEHPLLSPPAGRAGKEKNGDRSVIISPERQQLIGIKTTVARKENAIKTIRTSGRVAFDPELVVAQREFLEISKNVGSLRKAAISRLKLLGMSDEEIRSLEKKGRVSSNLYLPEKEDSVWVYATLYTAEANVVKTGMKVTITLPSSDEETFHGTIRTIDPVVDPSTRSVRARIEIPKAGGQLKPETFVNVSIQIDLGENLLIPKSAVMDSGTRKIAYVMTSEQTFEARTIKTGLELENDVIVIEGILENEKVVSAAAFLVDSESQLKNMEKKND